MVDGYNMGARNQHKAGGAYEFYNHRAYNKGWGKSGTGTGIFRVKAGRGPGRRMGAGNKGWGIESGQIG